MSVGSRHAPAPADPENLPAAQSTQAEASVSEYVPAGQVAQTEAPAAGECVPAAHGEHVAVSGELEPSGPYSPASHASP